MQTSFPCGLEHLHAAQNGTRQYTYMSVHPFKINMEAQNHPLERANHLPNLQGSMLVFQRVHDTTTTSSKTTTGLGRRRHQHSLQQRRQCRHPCPPQRDWPYRGEEIIEMERHAELGKAQRHVDDPRSKKGRKVWFALESSVKQSQAGSVYLQTMQNKMLRYHYNKHNPSSQHPSSGSSQFCS